MGRHRIFSALTLVAALMLGSTISLFGQLPGPPVGAPQSNQSRSIGYNFQYPFTPSATTGYGFRVNPTLNLTTATSQTDYLMDVAGTIVVPNSSASMTTAAGLHVGTLTLTLNSGTATNSANLVVDAEPSTGTNKYAVWSKGAVQMDTTLAVTGIATFTGIPVFSTGATTTAIKLTATTNQIVTGAGSNLTTSSYPASSGAVTLTFPTTTDTMVGRATTDTLTNKTLTSPVVALITNTGTLTLPTATGGVPVLIECGATGTGNQTCSAATATAATKIYAGQSTLSSNAAIITFPTAFAATTSYRCVANDITTRANPVQMLSTSTTTATITNTTGASDVINWFCIGQ